MSILLVEDDPSIAMVITAALEAEGLSVTHCETIAERGVATIRLDLLPERSAAQVLAETTRPRGPRSLATHLKSRLGIQGLKLALLPLRLPMWG